MGIACRYVSRSQFTLESQRHAEAEQPGRHGAEHAVSRERETRHLRVAARAAHEHAEQHEEHQREQQRRYGERRRADHLHQLEADVAQIGGDHARLAHLRRTGVHCTLPELPAGVIRARALELVISAKASAEPGASHFDVAHLGVRGEQPAQHRLRVPRHDVLPARFSR